MRTIARSLGGTIAGMVLLGSAASADPAGRCTVERWTVDGTALTATLCVPLAHSSHVTVSETFARDGQNESRSLDVDVVGGIDVTRAIDDVDLAGVGSTKQLHLTIVYRNGMASVEHALLLPGAVVLK